MLEPLPVASLCTENRLGEFFITKRSLEQYHDCKWHLGCDSGAQQVLERECNNVTCYPVIRSEASHIKGEYEPFLALVLNKMKLMRAAIEQDGECLFVDSDLVFTGPLPVKQMLANEILFSDHHITSAKIIEKFGQFNVGFIYSRDRRIIDAWEEITLRRKGDNEGLEQKPLQLAIEETRLAFDSFPATCNIGWWRMMEQDFFQGFGLAENQIKYHGETVTNFHLHLDPDIQRAEEQQFSQLLIQLLSSTGNEKHQELLSFIQQTFQQYGASSVYNH